MKRTDTLACSRDANERLLFFDIFRKAEELKKAQADVQSQAQKLESAQETISELEATNERIRNEVAISGLTEMQVQYVNANASDIEKNVHPKFHLDWKRIKFMLLLGSGTFGDCYKGSMTGEEVAVSNTMLVEGGTRVM